MSRLEPCRIRVLADKGWQSGNWTWECKIAHPPPISGSRAQLGIAPTPPEALAANGNKIHLERDLAYRALLHTWYSSTRAFVLAPISPCRVKLFMARATTSTDHAVNPLCTAFYKIIVSPDLRSSGRGVAPPIASIWPFSIALLYCRQRHPRNHRLGLVCF